MYHKLFGQTGVHQVDGESWPTKHTISNEVAFTRSKHHLKKGFFQAKGNHTKHDHHHQPADDASTQFIQMIPKGPFQVWIMNCELSIVLLLFLIFQAIHAFFETLYTFAQTFHELRYLFAAK